MDNFEKNRRALLKIKIIHTIIWIFFNIVLFYLFYAVWMNRIDHWVWICIGIILMEGVVLLIFNKFCPLTLMARKYSDSTKDNFDIFLPNWLAKHNKLIYTTFFVFTIIVLVYRLISN